MALRASCNARARRVAWSSGQPRPPDFGALPPAPRSLQLVQRASGVHYAVPNAKIKKFSRRIWFQRRLKTPLLRPPETAAQRRKTSHSSLTTTPAELPKDQADRASEPGHQEVCRGSAHLRPGKRGPAQIPRGRRPGDGVRTRAKSCASRTRRWRRTRKRRKSRRSSSSATASASTRPSTRRPGRPRRRRTEDLILL